MCHDLTHFYFWGYECSGNSVWLLNHVNGTEFICFSRHFWSTYVATIHLYHFLTGTPFWFCRFFWSWSWNLRNTYFNCEICRALDVFHNTVQVDCQCWACATYDTQLFQTHYKNHTIFCTCKLFPENIQSSWKITMHCLPARTRSHDMFSLWNMRSKWNFLKSITVNYYWASCRIDSAFYDERICVCICAQFALHTNTKQVRHLNDWNWIRRISCTQCTVHTLHINSCLHSTCIFLIANRRLLYRWTKIENMTDITNT